MTLISFANNQVLLRFAEDFLVKDRLHSLEYEVNRCLAYDHSGHSPLPAMKYCFSMIDLLGALYADNAKGGNTAANSKYYMVSLMKYDPDKADLLLKVYRHKTAHLSAPKTAINYKGRIISWKLHDTSKNDHLTISSESGSISLFGQGTIPYKGKFIVDIATLKDNIKESVTNVNGGYLDLLRKDPDLQDDFTDAVNDIYEPLQV